MTDQYKAPEHSKYGDTSVKQQLADGVYMIAANALIKVIMVAQKLADKMLSAPAKKLGEVEGDYLSYPDEKASIPLFELAQRGKVKLFDEQVKNHFGNLVRSFPDYLRERGIISEKPVESMTEKVNREFAEYQSSLTHMDKHEIISRANEITQREQIVKYLCTDAISRDNVGLLLIQEKLLYSVHSKIQSMDRPFTTENIAEAVSLVKGEASRNSQCVQKRLDHFLRELQVAKTVSAEAVELNMDTPEGAFKFAMNMEAFRATIDPDMLLRFAQTEMLDFPNPDYYGNGNEQLWVALAQKRFSANFAENFNNHAVQGENGYSLTVTKTLKDKVPENEFDGLLNRMRMKRYIESNCNDPNACMSEIKQYCKQRVDLIKDVKSMIEQEQTEPTEQSFEVEQGSEMEI